MPWSDQQPTSQVNAQQFQLFWQMWQEEQRRAAQLAEQSKQEKDAKGIAGWLGGVAKMPLDLAGDVATKAATGALQGLDWYDRNVVGQVWDNAVGPAITGAIGREWNDSAKYENLEGGAKFGAGLAADPLNYVPVAGLAGKGLKSIKGLEKVGLGIERGAQFADAAQFNAIKLPLKYGVGAPLKYGVGKPLGMAGEQLAKHTDLGAELSRFLREPTGVTVTRERTTATQAALNLVRTHALSTGRTDLTAPEVRDLFKGTVQKVDDYYKQAKAAKATENTALLKQLEEAPPSRVETLFHGWATGAYRPRTVTKRVAESFRRVATGSARVEKEVDLDRFDQVVGDYLNENLDVNKAVVELTRLVGNEDLADKVLLFPGSDKAKALTAWLEERKRGKLPGSWAPDDDELKEILDPNILVQRFGDEVGKQTQGDLMRSTSMAREFMNSTRMGPTTLKLGDWANNFDSVYGKVWKRFIDPKIMQPVTQLILGHPLFPLQNALEEVGQQMLGGSFSRRNWHLSADEFLDLWSGVDPTVFPILPSLVQGTRDMESARLLFEDRSVQRSLLAGTRGGIDVAATELVKDPKTGKLVEKSLDNDWLFPEKGWTGGVFGGKWLKLSNLWSSDMRRASYMNKWIGDTLDRIPDLAKLDGPGADIIKKAGWEQRFKAESVIAAAMKASGRPDEEILMHLRDTRMGAAQDLKRVYGLIDSADFKADTRYLLHKNAQMLKDPESRVALAQQAFDSELRRMTADSEHVNGFIDKWLDEKVAQLSQANDAESLIQGMMSFEDTRKTLDQLWHSYRAETARIRSVPQVAGEEEIEAWHFARRGLELTTKRNNKFRAQATEHFARVLQKLGPDGDNVLSQRGKARLKKLGEKFNEWTRLTDEKADLFRKANEETMPRGRKASSAAKEAQRKAHTKIQADYGPKVAAANKEIETLLGDDLTLWFKRGVAQKAAVDGVDEATESVADLSRGQRLYDKDILPVLTRAESLDEWREAFREYYAKASLQDRAALREYLEEADLADDARQIARLMDEGENLANEAAAPVEEAQQYLWERFQVEQLLNDDLKSEGFLAKYGSIFGDMADAPVEGYQPLYTAAAQKMKSFLAAIERLDDIPTLDPKLGEALEEATKKTLAAAGNTPDLDKTLKATMQAATDHYHKWYTNYDEGNTLDTVMRHFFPFWRYEKQRWPRLARAAAHNPWLVTNSFRMVDASEDGFFHVPGTNIVVNPLQGTLYNSFRELMQDGGFYYEKRGGAWDRLHQLSVAGGFYPGPIVAAPLAAKEGHLGEVYPTNINTILSAAEAAPLEGLSGGAHALRQLPDRWYEYRMNQELAAMGIHPYDATPEQMAEARKRAERSAALSGVTGHTVKFDNNWRKEQSELQRQAALEAGVPEEVVQEARRRGKNALSADKEGDPFDAKGDPYLNTAQRRGIEDAHPEWESLAAIRQSLRPAAEQNIGRMRRKTETSYQSSRDEAEAELLPVYQSFLRGEISPEQWRDKRKSTMDKLRGQAQLQSKIFTDETGQRVTSERDPARVDWLARQFYGIEAPTDTTGMPNYDALDFLQSRFLAENNVTQDELTYIQDIYPRKKFKDPLMNAVEDEFKQAGELNSQYYDLPKYPGLTADESEKADKALALAEKVKGNNPKLTITQALAVVARYDRDGAQLARKALTVQKGQRKGTVANPRKEFRDSQPLWQRYYGD